MRVFTAIDLPEAVKDSIEKVAAEFRIRWVTPVNREQLHITLHFLGDVASNRIGQLKDALSQCSAHKFEISLTGLSYFSPARLRVIYVDVGRNAETVSGMHADIAGRLGRYGFYPKRETYVPHVTIARVKDRADTGTLAGLIKKYATYDFGAFEVGSVSLKKSTLTGSGPVYDELYKLEL